MKRAYKFINIILIALFSALILARLFYNLGQFGIMDLDEGKHAAEAYEMFARKAWIAHTYSWEIDYMNSKPPLYYWLTNIFFALFGVSFNSFKLPSAIAAVITCVMLGIFIYRTNKSRFADADLALASVTLFLGAFLSMDYLYDNHMFRAGNFDSVYTLFMLAGILLMIKARKDTKYLIPMGVFAGLAFLSKGFNATTIVLSALCCIPFLAKEKRVKNILCSVAAATLVVLPWAALRFRFDGTNFFYAMFFGEAEDKIVGGSLGYFQWMPTILTFRLLIYALLFYIVALLLRLKSGKELLRAIISDLKEFAILWIWFWVPIFFYSWAGACNEWYIYSSCILAAVLFALYISIGIRALASSNVFIRVIASVLAVAFVVAMAANCIYRLSFYDRAGFGGGPGLEFWGDLKTINEKFGDEYRGSYVYMMDIYRLDQNEVRTDMFYDILPYAEYECDWHLVKGGIDAWENAEDGILIVNKDLFDQYADRLTGHVIMYDNYYLYFLHDMY